MFFFSRRKHKRRDEEIRKLHKSNIDSLEKSRVNLNAADKNRQANSDLQRSVTEQLWQATGGKTK